MTKSCSTQNLAVGSYRLISPLGSGGMGEVWLAKHRLLARPAAVKLIRQEAQPGAAREQLVRRFQREAQVTAGLRSPHTVQLYDFGVNDSGSFYYVMELLQGLDLHHIVNRFGPQPAERVIMLLRQACRSLAEAHEHGLVHRDIKPANLFVARLGSEYDYLKVLDFGIVKDQPGQDDDHALDAETSCKARRRSWRRKSCWVKAASTAGPISIRWRASAYWALTGQLAVRGEHAGADARCTTRRRGRSRRRRSPSCPIPKDLEAMLMQCLEKDPANDPSSALELDSQLARVRCEETRGPTTRPAPGGRRTRRMSSLDGIPIRRQGVLRIAESDRAIPASSVLALAKVD